MDILKAIKERREYKGLSEEGHSKEIVDKLIDSLIWAPALVICSRGNSIL